MRIKEEGTHDFVRWNWLVIKCMTRIGMKFLYRRLHEEKVCEPQERRMALPLDASKQNAALCPRIHVNDY